MKLSSCIKVMGLALSLSVMTTFSVAATPIDVSVCNDCSPSRIERSAERNARGFGHNHVIVVDFVNQSAKKFSVINSEDRHGEPITDTYEVAMSNDELHDVSALYEYRKEIIRSVKKAEQKSRERFPQSPSKSAAKSSSDIEYVYMGEIKVKGNPYDFMRESFSQIEVYKYYFSGSTGKLTQIISSTLNKIKFPSMNKMGVSIKIKFYSDSLAHNEAGTAIVSLDTTRERLDILAATDVDNNSVPVSKYQVSGQRFTFSSHDNQSQFNSYVNNMFGGSGGQGGGGCKVIKSEKVGDRYIFTYQCK